ncbi:DNA -binding domain-containing protein [Sphingosinicella sp. CPCC 101087]|uniref:DNA -binding domain-containing protein n=1 Tax=Sphingosinicella sp. CPCC 101087 TaxID=2497754 RepID=UPI00101D2F32|nr:DUF2285 domain-containing protein [Sphingosinicella sp. CPCC 101087]
MGRPPEGLPDWRDAAAYARLLRASRTGFAWEWLRRNPAYRRAAKAAAPVRTDRPATIVAADPRAAPFGLHAFEAPDAPVPFARPVWTRGVLPRILEARIDPGGADDDRFDLARLDRLATIVQAQGPEHLLLSDGYRAVRMDVIAGTLLRGPALLRYELHGFSDVDGPLLALRRLLALWRSGRFSQLLHPLEARAHRWIQMLRAHDALVCGASQREIAGELLSTEAAGVRWRVNAPSIRSRVQRLVRGARRMASGGQCSLLR